MTILVLSGLKGLPDEPKGLFDFFADLGGLWRRFWWPGMDGERPKVLWDLYVEQHITGSKTAPDIVESLFIKGLSWAVHDMYYWWGCAAAVGLIWWGVTGSQKGLRITYGSIFGYCLGLMLYAGFVGKYK